MAFFNAHSIAIPPMGSPWHCIGSSLWLFNSSMAIPWHCLGASLWDDPWHSSMPIPLPSHPWAAHGIALGLLCGSSTLLWPFHGIALGLLFGMIHGILQCPFHCHPTHGQP